MYLQCSWWEHPHLPPVRLDGGRRRTDRHRDELEQLKEAIQALEGRVLVLESEKTALELGMERLSERICRCSGASTRAPDEGSSVGSYEMSDASEVAEHHEVASPVTGGKGGITQWAN